MVFDLCLYFGPTSASASAGNRPCNWQGALCRPIKGLNAACDDEPTRPTSHADERKGLFCRQGCVGFVRVMTGLIEGRPSTKSTMLLIDVHQKDPNTTPSHLQYCIPSTIVMYLSSSPRASNERTMSSESMRICRRSCMNTEVDCCEDKACNINSIQPILDITKTVKKR